MLSQSLRSALPGSLNHFNFFSPFHHFHIFYQQKLSSLNDLLSKFHASRAEWKNQNKVHNYISSLPILLFIKKLYTHEHTFKQHFLHTFYKLRVLRNTTLFLPVRLLMTSQVLMFYLFQVCKKKTPMNLVLIFFHCKIFYMEYRVFFSPISYHNILQDLRVLAPEARTQYFNSSDPDLPIEQINSRMFLTKQMSVKCCFFFHTTVELQQAVHAAISWLGHSKVLLHQFQVQPFQHIQLCSSLR